MATITVSYGDQILDEIEDIDPATVLDAGDEAMLKLARQLGHRLIIDRRFRSDSGPYFDIKTKSFDAYHVEKRLEDRFEREWTYATDRAIEDS